MTHRLIRALCLFALLTVSFVPAAAQVRHAPAGNDLPEASTPDASTGLPETALSESAASNDTHEHAHDTPIVTMSREQHDTFAQQVDLTAFRKLSVFHTGRAKIIDTLARETLNQIYGKSRWKDAESGVRYDPVFTWLDLIFNRAYYHDKPLIHVEVLDLRRNLLADLSPEEHERWLKIGRLTPIMFTEPQRVRILSNMDTDLRLAKGINQVRIAWQTFTTLPEQLLVISPAPGSHDWLHLDQAESAASVREQFQQLATHWRAGDAPRVNQLLNQIATQLPTVHASTYPATWVRMSEYSYNRSQRFTIGYVAYAIGALALLIAFSTQRRWLIGLGLSMTLLGFVLHSMGMLVRGVLSGRWPIHNQFESFFAIAWFAVLVGLVLMFTKKQWLFGAAAAALGACSLLFANTVDIPSNEVGQVAGILATSRILYIHVNTVLASYALIALGFFVSLFYLTMHYTQRFTPNTARFAAAGLGSPQLAVHAGGAPSLEATTADESAALRQSLLRDLDKSQMVVLQLAFWILGVGILLGAYWADHAWGRWWAWDPKETWALITWIIYLIVIHVRISARNQGLITAWLSVVGFFCMLWCYWGVNLLLAGLHSYA